MDWADVAIVKKSALADVTQTEEPDADDTTVEEKADFSDEPDEEPDFAENTPGEKNGFPNDVGKQEPDPADSAIVRKAEFEVSIEWEEYKWKNGDKDQIFLLTPMYRPTKSLEFSLTTPHAINKTPEETARGVGDITFAGDYVLLWDDYENDDPLVTLEASIMFDTGSFNEGLGKGSHEYTVMPGLTKRVSESLALTGQVGYTIVSHGEEKNIKNYWPYAIEAEWTASERVTVTGGFSSDQHPDVTKPDQKVAELELSYEIADWLSVSATFRKGVTNDSPRWGIGFGIVFEDPVTE